MSIQIVGFDADDTLWKSQDYFDAAQAEFEVIIGRYIDLSNAGVQDHLLRVERENIPVFGYGAKGMMLSMMESAIEMTEERITSGDIRRILDLGKAVLQHPVELLDGIEAAVDEISRDFPIVLITKGDLFHQEAKVKATPLSKRFKRIEIVSEKDPQTYRRLFNEFGIAPEQFLMIGNSLKSDIAPVLDLGGWGVHVPYYTTWAHETHDGIAPGLANHLRTAASAAELPAHVHELARVAVGM